MKVRCAINRNRRGKSQAFH